MGKAVKVKRAKNSRRGYIRINKDQPATNDIVNHKVIKMAGKRKHWDGP